MSSSGRIFSEFTLELLYFRFMTLKSFVKMGFSKNSWYPPPVEDIHFQKMYVLGIPMFFFSFPGIPSKLSPPPGIFPFFSFYPLEFSKFKTPWNSVVLNSGVRTFFWKSPMAESITSYYTSFEMTSGIRATTIVS